jgi:subtilase family serine protease
VRSSKLRIRSGLGLATALAALALTAGAASAASRAPEYAPVCSHALPTGAAGCDSIRLLNPAANWHGSHAADRPVQGSKPGGGSSSTTPSGYYPSNLQSAYGLGSASANNGTGQTVAIVDAYDDPNAESDLAKYRETFHLGECKTGCFTKVNQSGAEGPYPTANTGWAEEISLDLDMVSAICPKCHILLVEASSNSLVNLGTAVDYAAEHANAVSNSYGAGEFLSETSYDSYYDHPGVAITVSSGDGGYGVEYPAASPFVTAVGGTTLKGSIAAGWSQTVWSGSGAGCSAVEPNPGWQPVTSRCSTRTVADTAADANPNTGVAVYDSYGEPGWMVFGGTSVSSPIIASVYALANTVESPGVDTAQALYGDLSLNKVTEGTDLNPRRCGTSYLCSASSSLTTWTSPSASPVAKGWYNGPTGNGTPNGLAGF